MVYLTVRRANIIFKGLRAAYKAAGIPVRDDDPTVLETELDEALTENQKKLDESFAFRKKREVYGE